MPHLKPLIAVSALLVASGCSTLSGGRGERADVTDLDIALQKSKEESAILAAEVSRLKSENARLANMMLALERETDEARARSEEAAAVVAAANEAEPALPDTPTIVAPPPNEEVIVAEADAPVLRNADVSFEEAPRLVQPQFASAEVVFENEAVGEIETASVLFGVHLASYREIVEAREGWRQLQRENPDELGLLEPRVEEVDLPGKGIFFRLVGGGFSSQAKAGELCGQLKAKGMFCSVAGFSGQRLSLADAG
ncbi:MAG: SPOR domain-containing protein [Pseudomonadota bacterium]